MFKIIGCLLFVNKIYMIFKKIRSENFIHNFINSEKKKNARRLNKFKKEYNKKGLKRKLKKEEKNTRP